MRNFLQKHKHLLCMACIVCAVLLIFGLVRVFALPGLSLKVQTTKFNTVTDAFTPALTDGDTLAQTFTTDRALTSVAVLPDLRACKGGAALHATLTDDTGTVLAQADAQADYTDANEPPYVVFVFDAPVPGGAPRTLTLTLTAAPQRAGDTVRFYKSADVQHDAGMGALSANGAPDAGSLTLIAETGGVQGFITPFFIVLSLLCAGALCAVYAAVRVLRWPLHRVYLTALVGFGLLYLLVIPPYGVTDEAQHITQAFNNSSRILGSAPRNIDWGQSHRRAGDTNSTLEENATTVFSYKEMVTGLLRTTPEPAASTVIYSREEVGGYQAPYALSSLGVLLGRLLHLGYVPTLLLGRLFNFALFALLTTLAVKHAPFGGAVFAAVGLLPGTLHVAASFSRDSFTLAVAFLFAALALRAAARTDALRWQEAAVLAGLCVLLAPSKAAYVPFVLLILLVPLARFAKPLHAWAYRAGTLCAAAFLYWRVNAVIVWDATMKSAENNVVPAASEAAASTADTVVTAVAEAAAAVAPVAAVNPDNITYSLTHILAHPVQTLGLLVTTLVESGTHYLNGLVGGTLGNNNLALSWTFVAAFFVLLALCVQCGKGSGLLRLRAWRSSVPVWLAVLGCCGLVVLGCVFWTPTYYTTIYGLQGRYFLPMLPLMLLLCKPSGGAAHADTGDYATQTDTRACALLLAFAAVQTLTILNIFYVVALR